MSFRTCLVVALVGIAWSCVLGLQRPPPRYSQQYMPDTAFSCRNKIVGSYYADPETDCQLFHVCVSVAGSIQDYKFLCPNDTAFDQESQTCADWYDVDCEAATLYYASDNFDLYRVGSGLESLHYDSVRSDAEPQDHLQRSETSDPVRSSANSLNRVTPTNYNANNDNSNSNSRDILRGSSSINFYNSRNGGKDEDYENEKVYRDEPIQEPRKKSGVRKIARKQHNNNNNNNNNNNYGASSTVAPVVVSSPSTNNYNGNFYNNNKNYNRQRTSAFPSSTTLSTVPQDNYNARNQKNQKYNVPTTTHRPSSAQQTFSTYQSPSTTARTTVYNNYNNNNAYNNNNNNNNAYNNNNQQQTSNSYGQSIPTSPKPTTYSQNYPSVAITTSRPTSYNQNYQEQQTYDTQYSQFGQNIRTQSTTVQPNTNYQSSDYTNYQRNYNNIQRSTSSANSFPTTVAPTTFYDSYSTNGGQYNKASGQPSTRQASGTQTTKYNPNYAGSSYIPTTYSPATNKAVINENTPIQNNARGVDRYNSQVTGNDNAQYNNQQQSAKSSQFYDSTRAPKKTIVNDNSPNQGNGRNNGDRYNTQTTNNDNTQYNNQQQSAKSTQYYDSTRAPKKATQYNSNYDNTNNGKYHESSTGSYDIPRSQGGIGFSPSSVNLLAETPRSTTPVPKRTAAPTTYNPNSFNANNQRQTQTTPRGTTYVSGSARPFSTTARFNDANDATTPRPKAGKKNDYDYAYYDNAGGLEYDGLDLEHVVAGNKESSKISRN